MKIRYLASAIVLLCISRLPAADPVVTNVVSAQRAGTELVDIVLAKKQWRCDE